MSRPADRLSAAKRRDIAARVVEETLGTLPEPLAAEARAVPCLLEEISEEDPDLLGLYENFAADVVSEARGPIILYLQSIADYCRDENLDFAEEVRPTYLHELGHHFGWNEGDLEERGLE
jgi:predicted Zn-dependent protease with MMP-like domain